MADLRKYMSCECIQKQAGILMPRLNDTNIVTFDDRFRMIDIILYDPNTHEWLGRKREFILSEAEYMKRKLHGCKR